MEKPNKCFSRVLMKSPAAESEPSSPPILFLPKGTHQLPLGSSPAGDKDTGRSCYGYLATGIPGQPRH